MVLNLLPLTSGWDSVEVYGTTTHVHVHVDKCTTILHGNHINYYNELEVYIHVRDTETHTHTCR